MAQSGKGRPLGSGALKLVAAAWVLALLCAAAYQAVKADPNAGLLLIAAALLAGVGLLRVLVAVLQRLDGARSGVWGYFNETAVLVLLLTALLAPWRVPIAVAHADAVFGWQLPLAWLAALGLIPALTRRLAPWEGVGLAVSGASLGAWLGWLAWLLFTPDFARLHFPFVPLDLTGVGWYLGLAAWVVAVESAASRTAWQRSGEGGKARLLGWALVPGAALLRIGRTALGRAYLLAAALLVFFLRLSAYTPNDFAYYATSNRLPPSHARTDTLVLTALLAAIWLASAVHYLAAVRASEARRQALPSWDQIGKSR
jgi:hypothetical protein